MNQINEKSRALAVLVVAVASLLGMAVLAGVYGWLPSGLSTLAPAIDGPFRFVVWTSSLLTVGVVGFAVYYVFRYRRRTSEDRTEPVAANHLLEISWIVIPTILVLVVFTWGFKSFVKISVAPANAYEIQVTGQKWFWEFEYPNGVKTANEFAIPVDRPVKLIMHSRDVIHSFFIPEFRVKHDVIPNRYTTVWFQATEETRPPADANDRGGFIQVFCTEYCGTNHSKMGAELRVLSPERFEEWLASRNVGDMTPAEYGALLYTQKTCVACHSLDGAAGVGPTFAGLFGSTGHEMSDGSTVDVDENYLRESLLRPQAKVVAGFQPVMPMFQFSDDEVDALVEYIKSLQ